MQRSNKLRDHKATARGQCSRLGHKDSPNEDSVSETGNMVDFRLKSANLSYAQAVLPDSKALLCPKRICWTVPNVVDCTRFIGHARILGRSG